MSDFASRKITRKVKKLKSMLFRDLEIECCDEPTKNLFIGNAGLTTGLQRENLLIHCGKYGIIDDVIMLPGKSYCFVVFRDIVSCIAAYDSLQAKPMIPYYPETVYLAYSKSVPLVAKRDWHTGPPGTVVLEDFVNSEEEASILLSIDWKRSESGQSLKNRRVIHYGYQFQYHNNDINKEEPLQAKIPAECDILFDRLRQLGYISSDPDQLTVNQYLPGQGIPPHIDTHSACKDIILSLSLGSSVVMDFKNRDGRVISLLLPQRSLLIMSGEARYAWTHGITPRKTDVVPCHDGSLTVQSRGVRTSFTFRWTRRDDCNCIYPLECDSYKNKNKFCIEIDENAAQLEEVHVHRVYEDIADHFSETRHKPWPNVLDFVQSFPEGSILVDVGCGNCKYFGHSQRIFEIGCDTSWNLSLVSKERGFQVFTCNCLAIPLKDNSADGCISIAVIHHLANQKRRLQALQEIVRVLRPGGMALIYVWAKNQEHGNKKSSYLKQNQQKRKQGCSDKGTEDVIPEILYKSQQEKKKLLQNDECSEESQALFSLPVHTNRTQFQHKDMLVPWKLKPHSQGIQTSEVQTFYRFYHVFEKGELENMCFTQKNLEVIKSFYDQGNWSIIIKKK